jgi:predicted nucleotidyltransferase
MEKPNFSIYKKSIDRFCKKYHITKLAIFGSILTSNFTQSSDVDFLVQFEKDHSPSLFGLVDMESELSTIIGHKADLRTPNELSRYFRDEVTAQAKTIYG